MNKGDYFGEVSMLFGCNRSATVKTSDYGMFGKIKSNILEAEVFIMDPGIKKALIAKTEYYTDSKQIFLNTTLHRISYLDKAPT